MIHSNSYLYGTGDVPKIPQEVIDERLRLLNENLTATMSVHYTTRDNDKVRAIIKAIKFWEEL